MYKFVATRCGGKRQRGATGEKGERREREGKRGQRIGDDERDTEESFSCPIGVYTQTSMRAENE